MTSEFPLSLHVSHNHHTLRASQGAFHGLPRVFGFKRSETLIENHQIARLQQRAGPSRSV